MSKDKKEPLEEFVVRTSWVGLDEGPASTANQFVSQFDEEMFYLSFGLLTPPLLLGTPEERREQLLQLDYLPVQTLARISVTPAGMRRLIEILQENLAKYESTYGIGGDES